MGNGHPDTTSTGEMPWEGAVNARHVLGSLYRMGRHEWMTARGWAQAYDDGVRTVIDLRNPDERRRRPTDPELAAGIPEGITLLNCPTEAPGHEEFTRLAVPYLNHPGYYADNVRIFPDRIAAVFQALAGAQAKVVLHCSAGRDRTGMIVSMLLSLAGRLDLVPAQYDAAARGINEWHRISPVRHPHERYLGDAELDARLSERLAALEGFVSGLDVEAFLRRQGLGDADLAALRRLLA